jgi:hypothetical protein
MTEGQAKQRIRSLVLNFQRDLAYTAPELHPMRFSRLNSDLVEVIEDIYGERR